MDRKYRNTAVENLVESLSFEVEAVPQDNVPQYKSTSHITPVNVKVRVRKKDKSGMQKGTICIPKVARTEAHPERIRLASSDQTIMSFNVLMEDPDNRKIKKKNVFGGCLNGTTDDDDDEPYLPKEQASGSKSVHKQKLALSKTAGNQFAPGDVQRKPKKFFGPCKPGGCLDPPFGEDRYSYLPPDTKKPSTENDTKIPDSHSVDDKIVNETPNFPDADNEVDTKTPKPHPCDDKIDEKTVKPLAPDHTTEKQPKPCPKKENTCPPFDYKVDPTSTPFPFNGFGSAPQDDTLNENEPDSKQRKRKGSNSDSAATVKVTKIVSGISNSVQNLSKEKRSEPHLQDKESNSIITYAGDEDDIANEKINKNRKSSVNTNRTSFDLNAPYYSPPKRDSRDKDANDKMEKLRRSFEPLGKAEDQHFPEDKDGEQPRMLRIGTEPPNEYAISTEHGRASRKNDDNFKNAKHIKRPSLQESQDNGIDKLKGYVGISLDNTKNEANERGVVFLDSPDEHAIETKIFKKDQVGTRENISKEKPDKANEKYKNDYTLTADSENKNNSNEKLKIYTHSNLSNSNVSGPGTEHEDRFDIQSGIDTEGPKNNFKIGILNQDINSQKDFDTKHTESPKKSDKPGPQSDTDKAYFGYNTPDKENTNILQPSPKDYQESQYIDSKNDSKPWEGYKENQRNSLHKNDSKDIVTLKSGAYYKEISDAESDYKVTDSRISLIRKKYSDNDKTESVQTATENDVRSLTKTPVTKIDINSRDKLHDIDVTPSNHHVVSVPPYSDDDRFLLENIDSRNRTTETRKYEEMLSKTGRDSDMDTVTQNFNEISVKTGRSLNTDIETQQYNKMSSETSAGSNTDIRELKKYDVTYARTESGSNIDTRTQKYNKMLTNTSIGSNTGVRDQKHYETYAKADNDSYVDITTPKYYEKSAKTGSGSNIDIRTQKYNKMLSKTSSGSNIDIKSRIYDESYTKTDNDSNIDIRDVKYDKTSAETGDGSNIHIRNGKYDESSTKTNNGSNTDIRTLKYDKTSSRAGSGSNMDIRIRKYDKISPKTGEPSNKLARDISLDLAFKNSFDGSIRVLRTLETPLDSKIQANPDVFVIQKRISLDGERTQVLIDPDTNMSIQLNRHSEDGHQEKDHNVYKGILMSDEHATHSHHHHYTHPHVTFSSEHLHKNLSYLYEKELVPLQNMIKELKSEIDALAGQHKRRERAMQQRLRPVGQCSGSIIKK